MKQPCIQHPCLHNNRLDLLPKFIPLGVFGGFGRVSNYCRALINAIPRMYNRLKQSPSEILCRRSGHLKFVVGLRKVGIKIRNGAQIARAEKKPPAMILINAIVDTGQTGAEVEIYRLENPAVHQNRAQFPGVNEGALRHR